MTDTGAIDRACVILIDMQNDVVRPGGAPLSDERQATVSNCVRLVAWARESSVPVVLVRVLRRPDGSDWPRSPLGRGGAQPAVLIEGTPGCDFIDELTPQPQDYVVEKRRTSAFYATSLDFLLQRLGRDLLVVGGIATNWGVESTVRDAWDRDYDVIVVSDCCEAFSLQDHEHSLNRVLKRRSLVLRTDEIGEHFTGSATPVS